MQLWLSNPPKKSRNAGSRSNKQGSSNMARKKRKPSTPAKTRRRATRSNVRYSSPPRSKRRGGGGGGGEGMFRGNFVGRGIDMAIDGGMVFGGALAANFIDDKVSDWFDTPPNQYVRAGIKAAAGVVLAEVLSGSAKRIGRNVGLGLIASAASNVYAEFSGPKTTLPAATTTTRPATQAGLGYMDSGTAINNFTASRRGGQNVMAGLGGSVDTGYKR